MNALTFEETGRITLSARADVAAGRTLLLSPDRTTLAVGVTNPASAVRGNMLWLVDVATFTVIDADSAAAGDQPVALAATLFIEALPAFDL